MSTHVLLNLLNELGKRDKMRGLLSILSHFCNGFNKLKILIQYSPAEFGRILGGPGT